MKECIGLPSGPILKIFTRQKNKYTAELCMQLVGCVHGLNDVWESVHISPGPTILVELSLSYKPALVWVMDLRWGSIVSFKDLVKNYV